MQFMRSKLHPFHVVNPTYTPLLASFALWGVLFFAVILLNPDVTLVLSSPAAKILGFFSFVALLLVSFFL